MPDPNKHADPCTKVCCNPDGLCYRVGCGAVATVVYVETIKKGPARLTRSDWCDDHAKEYPQPNRWARVEVRL